MRKHDEACEQIKRIEHDREVKEYEWKSKWEKSQMDLNQMREKCNRLEQDNEKLLSVIASLRKPVKRKPLPPKKVHLVTELIKTGMRSVRGGAVTRAIPPNGTFYQS